MANLICELEGVRGRSLKLYDTKIVIITKKTVGSFITGNITDGEKTIYMCDIVGVQHKKSGLLIGYLQFETPSMQMNNKNDNFFSENTFTYENGKNGITNDLMENIYKYITDRIEEIKYGSVIIGETPNFEFMSVVEQEQQAEDPEPILEEDYVQEELLVPEEENEQLEQERKERLEQERKERLEQMAEFRSRGLCQHCGGEFKGLTTKKCSKCGIAKNY